MDVMNKKGIIFSIASLFMAAFFMVVFAPAPEAPLDAGQESVAFRVNVLDRYSESWERFAGNALKTASYTALSRMSEIINDRNKYFNNPTNLQRDFESCLKSGTIQPPMVVPGPWSWCDSEHKRNFTLHYWLDEINEMAQSNLSINASYNVTGVELSQQFPFTVTVVMNMTYNITDSFATISRNVQIKEEVPIEGIRDPLGSGAISNWPREIRETSFRESDWSKDTLVNFTAQKGYRYSDDAPSFINRMLGDYSSSGCCGIDSVLNKSESYVDLSDEMQNASLIDYLYIEDMASGSARFGCAPEVYTITGTQIQMDQSHLVTFNVSGSEWLSSCG